jgi:hypothetical protein
MVYPKYRILFEIDYDHMLSSFEKIEKEDPSIKSECLLVPIKKNQSYVATDEPEWGDCFLKRFSGMCKNLDVAIAIKLLIRRNFESKHFGNLSLINIIIT